MGGGSERTRDADIGVKRKMEKAELQARVLDVVRSRVSTLIDASYENAPLLQIAMRCFVEGVLSGLAESARRAFDTDKPDADEKIDAAIRDHLKM